MVNAYIIAPKDLSIRTDNVPTLNPLSFSAAQINVLTNLPYGFISVNGKIFIGNTDDLPVFIKYADGRVDILDKPDTEAVAYGSFVVSGIAILVSENQERNTSGIPYLQEFKEVKRVVIGILNDGNIFVVYCSATIEDLKCMLCAYGVSVALLLSSDNVYFNNPRGGIVSGVRPIITLQAAYYEELPTPIIVIDPAHGGTDFGNCANNLVEKDLTLKIATEIKTYLKRKYYGTFTMIRNTDVLVPLTHKARFIRSIHADLVYACHINTSDGLKRGVEFSYCIGLTESARSLVIDLYTYLSQKFYSQGIIDNGIYLGYKDLYETYSCPLFTANTLYMDNAEDAHLLSKPHFIKTLAETQAEAIAQVIGLQTRVSNTQFTKPINMTHFKVNVGKFKFKLAAVELCEKLKKQGYDAYVTKE